MSQKSICHGNETKIKGFFKYNSVQLNSFLKISKSPSWFLEQLLMIKMRLLISSKVKHVV